MLKLRKLIIVIMVIIIINNLVNYLKLMLCNLHQHLIASRILFQMKRFLSSNQKMGGREGRMFKVQSSEFNV